MEGRRALSRRRFLSGLGLGAAGIGIAACTAAPAPQVVKETVIVEVTAAGPPAAEPMAAAELSFWIWWPNPVKALNQTGQAFSESQPAVKVAAQSIADFWTKLQTALAGGAGPDIFYMNNVNYYSWAHKGILWDLTPAIEADSAVQTDMDSVHPVALSFYNYSGAYYGVPHGLVITSFGYNKTYIEEQGLTPPADIEDDFDWNDWLEYALALTQKDGDKVSMWGTFSTGGIELGWGNQVISNGGRYLSEDGTKCVVNSEESLEAWRLLVDMRQKHVVSPGSDVLSAENEYSLFHTGRLATFPLANGLLRSYNEELKDFVYDISMLPKAPNTGLSRCYSNICGVCVNKDSKARDQAAAFVLYTLSKRAGDIWSYADVLAPARVDCAEAYFDPAITGPANRSAFFRQFQTIEPLPTHPLVTWGEMMKPTQEWATEIFEGRVGVEEGLQGMEDAVNEVFAKAGTA